MPVLAQFDIALPFQFYRTSPFAWGYVLLQSPDPLHLHYDVRFALRCRENEDFRVSDESHDLAWVPLANLSEYTKEESVLRMARKWALHES